MKIIFSILFSVSLQYIGFGQIKSDLNTEKLLAELAENACKCVDSIEVNNKSNEEISRIIKGCLEEETSAYLVALKLVTVVDQDIKYGKIDSVRQIDISSVTDKNSKEYKHSYYELERYMMANCKPLKSKISSHDLQHSKSISDDPKALEYYSNGLDESDKKNYKKAIDYFEKAIKIDPEFAFAYDNMGICYRQLGDYDKALKAYQKSLEIDPNGLMPLQNIAVVYQYKKQYENALVAYKKLAEIDGENPETYYGIGLIYALSLNDFEQGLDYVCKSYILYIAQGSPYRSDAEKLINLIYAGMKKQGKEEKFNEILKSHNISQ